MSSTDEAAARRDQALEDLLEVDRQVELGELGEADAAALRSRYQREALAAMSVLERDPDQPNPPVASRSSRAVQGGSGSRRLLYVAGALLAVSAALLVPRYAFDRPLGGLVTGNEVYQQGSANPSANPPAGPSAGPSAGASPGAGAGAPTDAPSSGMDLSKVSDAQMERVIAANPTVIGMRLALAERYFRAGRYDLATVHYAKALQQQPDNGVALAHLGWINYQVGRTAEAAPMLDRAVRTGEDPFDALWFQANVRLGESDPRGAVESLDALLAVEGLRPAARQRIEDLRATAIARGGGGR